MTHCIAIAALGVAVVWIVLHAILRFSQNPKEPIVILNSIPFLNPIFAILVQRYKLFMDL